MLVYDGVYLAGAASSLSIFQVGWGERVSCVSSISYETNFLGCGTCDDLGVDNRSVVVFSKPRSDFFLEFSIGNKPLDFDGIRKRTCPSSTKILFGPFKNKSGSEKLASNFDLVFAITIFKLLPPHPAQWRNFMKSSTMARTFELAKLAAKIGVKELWSGDFNSRMEQAVLIAKSLSHLKGAAMKMGQLLSLELDNYFPPEAVKILSQLQNAAIAHPYDQIEKVIQSEWSQKQRKSIQSLSREPIAVASIGQVHKAQYLGRDIVLKVQLANLANSVESDLKILKTLATSFCRITGRKMNLHPLFKEIRTVLEQELDYVAEAEFQTEFRRKIVKINTKENYTYRVPEVIPELSTKKILAMNFEPGLTFRQWLYSNPSRAKKNLLARAMLDLYFREFFEWGLVQTDPNGANFLIDENGLGLSICLLDFGATRKYSRKFIQNYIKLLDFTSTNQSRQLRTLSIEMGLMDPRESDSAFKAFEETLKMAIRPFFIHASGGTPYFDFSDKSHGLASQAATRALASELVYSPPPHSIIFLHRKLAGVYSILKSLEVQIDISSYWQMMKDF